MNFLDTKLLTTGVALAVVVFVLWFFFVKEKPTEQPKNDTKKDDAPKDDTKTS